MSNDTVRDMLEAADYADKCRVGHTREQAYAANKAYVKALDAWRAAGRPGVGESVEDVMNRIKDDLHPEMKGRYVVKSEPSPRESALWACVLDILRRWRGPSGQWYRLAETQDLPALCAALGVEVGDE